MLRSFTLSTLLPVPPRAWQLPMLLAVALFMSSCGSTPKIPGVPSSLPDIPLYGSASTPPHSMSRGDYPFDSSGNYVTSWAAQGGRGGSSSYTSGHSEEMPPAEPPSSGRREALSKVQNAPPEIVSSYSASGGRRMNQESAARKGGAPKSSPTTKKSASSNTPVKKSVASTGDSAAPKKKAGSASASSTPKKKGSSGTTKHVVKSTDTLAGIAKKYGTTEKKLKAANGLKSDVIRDGRALVIPK